jgi:hypothetical protein
LYPHAYAASLGTALVSHRRVGGLRAARRSINHINSIATSNAADASQSSQIKSRFADSERNTSDAEIGWLTRRRAC